MARRSKEDESSVPSVFQPGDLVTVRDQTAKAFEPKYKGEYRIIKMLGKTQVLLRDSKGGEVKHHVAYLKKMSPVKHHVAYLKKTNPVKETVEKIPDFKKFGRMAKLQLNPELVPNLK